MERKVVDHNPIVVFNRDVEASELNELFKDFSGDIVINGDLILEGELNIKCHSLSVLGAFEVKEDVTLEGDLYVKQYIDCGNLSVKGSVHCEEHILSYGDITITENLLVNKEIAGNDLSDLWVAGDLICNGPIYEFREVRVFNKLKAKVLGLCGIIYFEINY